MRRVMAFDYGLRRVGVAVSDPLRIIANPLNTLQIKNQKDALEQIMELCREYEPELMIVGYPIGTGGNKTEQTRIVDDFITELKKQSGLEVLIWDERFTSVEALSRLREQGIRIRENNKGLVDQMSARIMLQEYLDSRSKT